ncbi:MAG: mechanosensitive ion channel [Pseudomonadales bacterium]|nr:mechanosensitive ion channel family protein [Pseudomonadales bacterium]NIX09107.1 mechanosensitive ion channel [Pseudomonadales bacterium]
MRLSLGRHSLLPALGAIWLACCPGHASAQQSAVPDAAGSQGTPAEAQPTTDLTSRTQATLTSLDRLSAEINELGQLDDEAAELDALEVEIGELLDVAEGIDEQGADASFDGLLVKARALAVRAETVTTELSDQALALEAKLEETRQTTAQWQRMRGEVSDIPDAISQRIGKILSTRTELENRVNAKLNETVELQNDALGLLDAVRSLQERFDSYGRSRRGQLLEANAPPVWSIESEHIGSSSERAGRDFIGTLSRDYATWVETSQAAIGGHFLLLPLLLFLLSKLKAVALETPTGALSRPTSTGLLVWMLFGVAIYAGAPVAVRTVYIGIASIVTGFVLVGFLDRRLRAGAVAFLVLNVVEDLISGFRVTDALPRLVYLLLAIGAIVLVLLARRPHTLSAMLAWRVPRPILVSVMWTGVALLALSSAANVAGYVYLSQVLVNGVLASTGVLLVLFAGLTSVSEIIVAVLSLDALNNVRSIANHRYRLNRALRRPLVLLAMFLWAWATTRAFGIDDWVIASIGAIIGAEMSIGSVTLSLQGVLVFVIAVLSAVWASRIVRAVLNDDVLPRMQLPRGVPNTISMTLHYSIILIGLLLGVGFMGIDLSSLAFIVGALGVGIGFGLQNLVNNFVSGLILIFEAPIQVGDTVEVGPLMGKVVQIGIRTSRVRTFGGSEVIVPNGDLVSNQVINWTLSDRSRRLELEIGVAYGSDPEKVTEVLRSVVDAEDEVLDDPAPIIMFESFGDSSLNFRIFAWIDDFDKGFGMRHRLNVAINRALAEAGFEIPFPQRDLHIKNVPPGLGAEPA